MIKRRCLLGPWQLHQLLLWQLGMVGRLSLHSHLLGFWDYAWMRFWLVLLCSSVGFIGFKLPEVISSKATLFTSTKNRSEDLTPRSRSTAVQVGEIMRIYISQMLDIWYKKRLFPREKSPKVNMKLGPVQQHLQGSRSYLLWSLKLSWSEVADLHVKCGTLHNAVWSSPFADWWCLTCWTDRSNRRSERGTGKLGGVQQRGVTEVFWKSNPVFGSVTWKWWLSKRNLRVSELFSGEAC